MEDEKFVYVPSVDGPKFIMNRNFVTGLEGTKDQFRELYQLLQKMFEGETP
jgi:hypothetical protein